LVGRSHRAQLQLERLEDRLAPAAHTWSGGGTNTLWSNPANWSAGGAVAEGETDVQLTFPAAGVMNFTSNNDRTTLSLTRITIEGSGYMIGGNAVTFAAGNMGINATNATGVNTINLPLTLAGMLTGTVTNAAASLTLGGMVGGTGGLTKDGSGTLTLSSDMNNYTGTTTVRVGTLVATANNALGAAGAANGTSVAANATLRLENGITTAEVFTLGGGTLQSGAGANTITGGITQTANSFLVVDTGAGPMLTVSMADVNLNGFNLTANIGGAATISSRIAGTQMGSGLTKEGAGTLTLSNNTNNYVGTTAVNAGTLVVTANNALGDVGANNGTTVANGGTLAFRDGVNYTAAETVTINGTGADGNGALQNLAGANTFAGPITLASSSLIMATAGTLTLTGATGLGANTLTVTPALNSEVAFSATSVISGAGGIVKRGDGTLTLSGNNTYDGATTIENGTVVVTANNALGSAAGSTTVNTLATLALRGPVAGTGLNYTTAEPLFLNGAGRPGSAGALSNLSETNTFAGVIVLNSGSTINAQAGSTLNLTGTISTVNFLLTFLGGGSINANQTISGGGGVTQAGPGIATLGATNTYGGATSVNNGTLRVGAATNVIPDTSAVNVSSGATLDLNNFSETIGSLAGAGSVNLGSGTLTVGDASSTELSGSISGSGSLTKVGTGTLTLSGVNSYTGPTTINAGSLVVNGNVVLSTFTVNSGATLGGSGTVGPVNAASGATLNPGVQGGSPVTLNTGALGLGAGSTLILRLNGTGAGNFDQLSTTGTVNLGGATLMAILNFTPAVGNAFTLIQNDGTDAVVGTFAGLAEGATLTLNGQLFQITYRGGDGNDVVMTRFQPPCDANVVYVTSLYLDVLNRNPDTTGLNFWVGQLRLGMNRAQLAFLFWNSVEHRGMQVDQFYQRLLNRVADPRGRTYWMSELMRTGNEAFVTVGFVTSTEYRNRHASNQAFVQGLFQDLYGRQASARDTGFWVGKLNDGDQTRRSVALFFVSSPEGNTRLLIRDYELFLQRPPDTGGQQALLNQLARRQTSQTSLAIAFLSSTEHQNRYETLCNQGQLPAAG
jgi:autotransporter-associated beta strand protein